MSTFKECKAKLNYLPAPAGKWENMGEFISRMNIINRQLTTDDYIYDLTLSYMVGVEQLLDTAIKTLSGYAPDPIGRVGRKQSPDTEELAYRQLVIIFMSDMKETVKRFKKEVISGEKPEFVLTENGDFERTPIKKETYPADSWRDNDYFSGIYEDD